MPAASDDRSFFMGPGEDDNLFCELPTEWAVPTLQTELHL